MALIIKACLILSSLIGVATAISIPISMTSATNFKRNSDNGFNFSIGGALEQISEEEQENERGISFDDLGSEVEQDFQRENNSLGSSIVKGKNELKEILNSEEHEAGKGELQEKHGKNCIGDGQSFCGYLVFKEKTNTDYKVQVIYDNQQNEKRGKVKVIKNSGDITSYYDETQAGGTTKATPNLFHELREYDNEFSNKQGEEISHGSILSE